MRDEQLTGTCALVHRYSDPATAQFLSVDPLVDLTGTPYAYTSGDPVNGMDPLGLGCGIFSVVCDVGHVVASGAKWVYHHPAETIGVVAGVAAAATGVGALADATILGLDAGSLAVVSSGAGLIASGADVPGCLSGSTASCVGVAANLVGAGLGVGGVFADEGSILTHLLSSKSFSIGLGAVFWDLISGSAEAQPAGLSLGLQKPSC